MMNALARTKQKTDTNSPAEKPGCSVSGREAREGATVPAASNAADHHLAPLLFAHELKRLIGFVLLLLPAMLARLTWGS